MKKYLSFIICSLVVLSACNVREPSEESGEDQAMMMREKVAPAISAEHIITSKPPASFIAEAPQAYADEAGETYVTVYNGNLGLVKEIRELSLKKGSNEVRFSGVAAQIDPTSVKFRDLTDKNTSVLEQNYRNDLVSQNKLLERYVDEEISVTVEEGDSERKVSGTLLSYADGIVLKTGKGIEAFRNVAGFALPSLEGLLTKPTLVWLIQAMKGGEHNTETSYLTGGLTWRADYVAVLRDGDEVLDLKGWTTIDNNSGAEYKNAQLQLVAGTVNRVQPPRPQPSMYKDMAVMEARGMGGGGGFEEEGLFEYHLYTLGRRTHLRDKEQKQIELLSNEGVTAEKKYEFDHQKNHEKVRTTLEIENSEKAGLGMPLPGGIIRAFKADSSGQLQFVGEDRIDHTPKDDDFDVFLGLSFDITAERKVMDNRPITSIVGRGGETQQVQVEILNSKDEDIVVTIVETLWGRSAEVTHPNVRKEDANTFEIDVPVPAGKKVKVSYGTKMMY